MVDVRRGGCRDTMCATVGVAGALMARLLRTIVVFRGPFALRSTVRGSKMLLLRIKVCDCIG